ncbi:MAG: alpha-amylase family protein [Prevotella sp.]|nr:alpha-amylase family protein [Prevotella sp.]
MKKTVIYQIFTRLYTNKNNTRKPNGTIEENGCGKMNDFSPSLLKQIREMGVTHVWYTGLLRHATMTDYSTFGIPRQHPAVVKGRAGSPYAICDYYDVAPDLAVDVKKRMEEFERLVNRTHRAGLKMIVDFVPNHVARQYKSIAHPWGVHDLGQDDDPAQGFTPRNNFYYCPGQAFTPYFDLYHGERRAYSEKPAKATGNDCFHNAPGMNDWYETVKLNYGVDYYAGQTPSSFQPDENQPLPDTWQKMLRILLFWAGKGVDGFRCDMVEMVPASFWAWATQEVRERFPEVIFIGEVYNPQEYRHYVASGFDLLYDKVGMYDVMFDVLCHHRDAGAITQAWQQTDDIRQHMLYFLENHDELRLASDFFLGKAEKALPAFVTCALLGQNPVMLYAGQEWGERGMDEEGFSGLNGRTTIFDYWSLSPDRDNDLSRYYRRVLDIAGKEKAIEQGQMFDLMYVNQHLHRQYAFIRAYKEQLLLIVANFDDVPVNTEVFIPQHAFNYLNISPRTCDATDLLTGKSLNVSLQPGQPISISLGARESVVLKL